MSSDVVMRSRSRGRGQARTPSVARQLAPELLATVAGPYAPVVRAATNLYRTARVVQRGYQAYQNYSTQRRQRAARRRITRKGFGGVSTGVYQGRFKKPKRVKATKLTNFLSQGVVEYRETYGDINDPDCVYLSFSTWNDEMLQKVVTQAILKKLFKKAGINIDAINEETLTLT